MKRVPLLLTLLTLPVGSLALASPVPVHASRTEPHAASDETNRAAKSAQDSQQEIKKHEEYVDRLAGIRDRVMQLENGLLLSLKTRHQARANLKKLQVLIQLQRQEREIGKKRMQELQDTVRELETRQESLNEKITLQRKTLRKYLIAIESSTRRMDHPMMRFKWEKGTNEASEAPRRKLLANLTSRGLNELEILEADLSDAQHLESKIDDEKGQLTYLFQDLNERESVLELNRQMQVDLLRKNREERISQLENYTRLKAAQSKVETLIGEFNARKELEKAVETERIANRAVNRGGFEMLKGKLNLPVIGGKILTSFGRAFDPKTKLFIFKKGIDIQSEKGEPVQAVFAGKVAFSGKLPDYGKVTIIDHGHHFYTLCAHLGTLSKKVGDTVAAGDAIGLTGDSGIVYFEIRSHNIAVNPLQWVSNSFTLKKQGT